MLRRFLTPLVWKLAPRRRAEAMREYALIEKDSGCQLLDALDRVDDPALRAELFQQVLEEFHHADLFDEACKRLSDLPVGTPVLEREKLEGDLLELVAYVHVGEAAVDEDFGEYARAPLDREIAQAFARARADERHHVAASRKLLERFPGSPTLAILRARLTRARRAAGRALSAAARLPLAALLLGVYAAAGAFVRAACRRRLELPRDEQFRIFREQAERA